MTYSEAPTNPFGASPLRRPGSVRRTSTIDTHWPAGSDGPMHIDGHARDVVTRSDGLLSDVGIEDRISVIATPMRGILSIRTEPPRAGVVHLEGKRAGGHLRAVIDEYLPEERDAGSPLYLLLDDLSGATLVAGWAWSRWMDNWMEEMRGKGRQVNAGRNGRMEGVCIGFAPGSSALMDDGSPSSRQNYSPVPPLHHPEDPQGWHPLRDQEGVGMRRARRIDAWREGKLIHIDSGFQDSSTSPSGQRIAVHEYHLTATADANAETLTSLHADPRILPFPECPRAAANIGRLLGARLRNLRARVLEELDGTAGCTHLNDALRALAEVPQMLALLDSSSRAWSSLGPAQ